MNEALVAVGVAPLAADAFGKDVVSHYATMARWNWKRTAGQ